MIGIYALAALIKAVLRIPLASPIIYYRKKSKSRSQLDVVRAYHQNDPTTTRKRQSFSAVLRKRHRLGPMQADQQHRNQLRVHDCIELVVLGSGFR